MPNSNNVNSSFKHLPTLRHVVYEKCLKFQSCSQLYYEKMKANNKNNWRSPVKPVSETR